MATTLSVSNLNEQIKAFLETTFEFVSVEGELSRVTKHGSGHIYFTLKDATSSIKCVMFRGNASRLKFDLQEGAHVILHGALSLYAPRGEYQINCVSAEPYGAGALSVAFEQLKKKLEAKGYFDPAHKKNFPKYPKKIILVTSATGAALQDMQRVTQQRWPLVQLIVIDVLVQGASAAREISDALRYADMLGADAVVVGRGGGSVEDLWAFNEEVVCDALYAMQTPVVSAVGHEIDWVISDYVEDLRAPTPSAALQMILPDQHELMQTIDEIKSGAYVSMMQNIHRKREQLLFLQEAFKRHNVEQKLNVQKEQLRELQEKFRQQLSLVFMKKMEAISPLRERLDYAIDTLLVGKKNQIMQLESAYETQAPKHKNKSGFAQITKNGVVISLETLVVGDEYEAMSDVSVVTSKVVNVTKLC
jgi:exodeoxyribonuclease VII large subunit